MWWLVTGWTVQAHPFQEQFVGHRNAFVIHPNQLDLTTTIEVPIQLLERYFQQSTQVNKREWLEAWMVEIQSDISEQWVLEINGQRRDWSQTTCLEPTFKESSKFLVFTCDMHLVESSGLETLLMLDQILIDEPSVYWTSVDLDRSIQILETDRIQWSNKERTRYTSTLERWQMENTARETRVVMKSNDWLTYLESMWNTHLYQAPNQITLTQSVLPMDWLKHWKRKEIPWWMGGVLMVIGLIGGWYNQHPRVALMLPPMIFLMPVMPWRWHTAMIVLLLLSGVFDRQRCWIWWWMGLAMVLKPLWWISIVWVMFNFGHILVFLPKKSRNTLK